jgi:hypothetical protein
MRREKVLAMGQEWMHKGSLKLRCGSWKQSLGKEARRTHWKRRLDISGRRLSQQWEDHGNSGNSAESEGLHIQECSGGEAATSSPRSADSSRALMSKFMSFDKVFHCIHESIDGWVSASNQRETGRAVGECNTAPNDKIIGEIMQSQKCLARKDDVMDGICRIRRKV